jgi:hypothetical protein
MQLSDVITKSKILLSLVGTLTCRVRKLSTTKSQNSLLASSASYVSQLMHGKLKSPIISTSFLEAVELHQISIAIQ